MKIEIRKNGAGVIITFDTQADKFDSDYERNKFFRELHGWNQVVPSGGKRYEYRRPGILDDVPHIRVANSAFIVAIEDDEDNDGGQDDKAAASARATLIAYGTSLKFGGQPIFSRQE